MLEATGRLDRKVEGLATSDVLLRRGSRRARPDPARARGRAVDGQAGAAGRGRGTAAGRRSDDGRRTVRRPSRAAMRKAHADAHPRPPPAPRDRRHQGRQPHRQPPRPERRVRHDRGRRRRPAAGRSPPSSSLERLLDLGKLWDAIETRRRARDRRASNCSRSPRAACARTLADVIRAAGGETRVSAVVELLEPGLRKGRGHGQELIRAEVRGESGAAPRTARRARRRATKSSTALVRLFELDGVFGDRRAGRAQGLDELARDPRLHQARRSARASTGRSSRSRASCPTDQWERLLAAGLARDFEQLRIDFLNRTPRRRSRQERRALGRASNPKRIAQFRQLIERAQADGRGDRADARADRRARRGSCSPADAARRRPDPGARFPGGVGLGL